MAKQKSPKRSEVAVVGNLAELLKPYQSGWVALSSDEKRVVGNGETLHDAQELAAGHGVANAVFVKIIPPDRGYLPPFL
jgi:hypothetical protein